MVGRPIYFAAALYLFLSIFFAIWTYRRESARQPPADTTKRVSPLAMLIKYPQTFDPQCPPLLQEGKMPKKFGQNFDLNHVRTAIFLNGNTLSENKKQTCQGPMIGLPPYQTRGRWVPPTLRTVGTMGVQKGKSVKFLIYPLFQRCTHGRADQYYTNSQVPGCAHKISTDIRPTLPPFLQGGRIFKILAKITTQIVFGLP